MTNSESANISNSPVDRFHGIVKDIGAFAKTAKSISTNPQLTTRGFIQGFVDLFTKSHEFPQTSSQEDRNNKRLVIQRVRTIGELLQQYSIKEGDDWQKKLVQFEQVMGQLIHPDMPLIVEYVDKQIQSYYDAYHLSRPRDTAFIVAGSMGNGGWMVKEFAGAKPTEQDIDLFMLYDDAPEVTSRDFLVPTEIARSALLKQDQLPLLDKHYVLDAIRGTPTYVHIKNIKDIADARQRLDSILHIEASSSIESSVEIRELLNLFFLSIPPEVSHRNRAYLLEALQEIHTKSPEEWNDIRNRIYICNANRQNQGVGVIKGTYFFANPRIADKIKNQDLKSEVHTRYEALKTSTNQLRTNLLFNLIDATNAGNS